MNETKKDTLYNNDEPISQEIDSNVSEDTQNLEDVASTDESADCKYSDEHFEDKETQQKQGNEGGVKQNFSPYGGFTNNSGYYGYNPNFVYIPNQGQNPHNFNNGNFYGYNYANQPGNYSQNPYYYNPVNYGNTNNAYQGQSFNSQKQFTNQTNTSTQTFNTTVDTANEENTTTDDTSSSAEKNKNSKSNKKRSFTRSIWFTVVVSVVSSVLTACILLLTLTSFPSYKNLLSSFYGSQNKLSGQTNNPSGTDVTLEGETIEKGDDVTINIEGKSAIAQAVYAKAVNSVVGISVSQISGSKWDQIETVVSMGSGVVYSSDGLIVTNHHVIEAALDSTGKKSSSFNIQIYFDNELTEWTYVTEIVGFDAENDIAVLRADAKNLQPIEFADSDTLVTGETAISMGSPGGLSYMNSISEGILSGVNRTINTGTSVIYDLIQTTAAINPGNSGGALLNSEGKLIGICVIKIAATNYESMGFAINSNTVKTIVESILEYGYYNKPLLGVTVNTTYTPTIAKEQGWEAGAYIESVSANSAAAKVGISAGDIITKLDETKITSFAELRRFLLDCQPGDSVNVTIYNSDSGETKVVLVTLSGTEK